MIADLNLMSLPELFDAINPLPELTDLFARMKQEDLGAEGEPLTGDVTTSLLDMDRRPVIAEVRSRERGVIAGLAAVPALTSVFGGGIDYEFELRDGDSVSAGQCALRLRGSANAILTLERSLLNLVARLSGVASLTAAYVSAAAGTRARICDTRKTTPGMRHLEKYAVRCGGGWCHRIGLWDALLLKDNHIAALSTTDLTHWLNSRLRTVRAARRLRFVEVEVDRVEQFEAVLRCDSGLVDFILLDNMGVDQLATCVRRRDETASDVLLEASGGINLQTVEVIARTGVDRISVGALTHSATVLDLGLDVLE